MVGTRVGRTRYQTEQRQRNSDNGSEPTKERERVENLLRGNQKPRETHTEIIGNYRQSKFTGGKNRMQIGWRKIKSIRRNEVTNHGKTLTRTLCERQRKNINHGCE